MVEKLRSLGRMPKTSPRSAHAADDAHGVQPGSPIAIGDAQAKAWAYNLCASSSRCPAESTRRSRPRFLHEAGHEVVGLSMQLYDQREATGHGFGRCCSLDDLHDARRVAAAIGIPHYVLNLERQFQDTVVANFVGEYAAGPHADSLHPLQQRPEVLDAGRSRGRL